MHLDFFAYGFVYRALIGGMIVAVLCSTLGVFLVLKRLSLMGDVLAHSAFAGVALGVFANITPVWGALGLSVLNAVGITRIKQSARISGDAAMAVFFSFGLALGIVLISLSPSFTVSLSSLLFGSILLISWTDVGLILAVSAISVAVMLLLFKEFFYVALDEELARSSGLPVNMLNYLLSVLIGIIIVAGMRMVGILLISALLAIPALASMQLSASFKQTILLSIAFGLTSVLVGMLVALEYNVAPGGAIVLTSIGIFMGAVTVKKMMEGRSVAARTGPPAPL